MANINTITVSGNLTRDPELKDTGTTNVCNFSIAINRSRKENDEWVNEVDFIDVEAWGEFGQLIARKFAKGELITINGNLRQDKWTNPEGQNRTKHKILARQADGRSMYKSADEDRQPSLNNDPPLQGEPATVSQPVDDGIPF